jgi:asparagine synthetase B (glutamine-hydrolysing)
MSLTAFVVRVEPPSEQRAHGDARLQRFLSALTKQESHRIRLGSATIDFSSAYLDEAEGAVSTETDPRDSTVSRTIIFDGWLENREELIKLCAPLGGASTCSDSSLVLKGLTLHGEKLLERLYGEYSFVVICSNLLVDRIDLLAARDKVGLRPLFFSEQGENIGIANFPGALALIPWVGAALNDGYAAEFLATEINSVAETIYDRVARITGGHVLTREAGRKRIVRRYWRLPTDLMRNTAGEYPIKFRTALNEAVIAATASHLPVSLLVSGGIDSSSIAVVLSGLQASTSARARDVVAYSLVYPGLDCDESQYIDAIEQAITFPVVRVQPRYFSEPEIGDFSGRLRYPLGSFVGSCVLDIHALVRARNGRVLVNGEGGDELLVPTATALWSAFADPRDFSALVRYLRVRHSLRPRSMSWRGQLRFVLEPFQGFRASNFLSRRRERRRSRWASPVDIEWGIRVALSRRLDSLLPSSGARTLAGALASSGFWSDKSETLYFFYFLQGLEPRSPLMSARLMELANRLPPGQLDGQSVFSRTLLRKCLVRELPAKVASRIGKAEFSAAVRPALERATDSRFSPGWARPVMGQLGSATVERTGPIWRLDAAQSLHAFIAALQDY